MYVYLIQKGYGAIKIGVSKDPEKRCKELQIGNGSKLFLIAKFPCKTRNDANILEKELHRKFEKFRMNGEWFKKRILKEFSHRAELFPHIFQKEMKVKFNSYHENSD